MLLPAPLFNALAPHFQHHGCWHVGRMPGQDDVRLQFPGECGRELFDLNAPGSGCDFLRFHRRMMRHFYWVLDRVPAPGFRFVPWSGPELPSWVEAAVRARHPELDIAAAYRGIEKRIQTGTIEELGGFTERNHCFAGIEGAGLHNAVHNGIAAFERDQCGGDDAATMTDMSKAPGNLFFWTLHAWIDERFAAWQRVHGEQVDVTPAEMPHVHVNCGGIAELPV